MRIIFFKKNVCQVILLKIVQRQRTKRHKPEKKGLEAEWKKRRKKLN